MFRANRMLERETSATVPAVHGNIVPTQMQSPGTEGTVRFDPIFHNPFNDCFQGCFQLRKTVPKQQAQVNALGAIVELALVNG